MGRIGRFEKDRRVVNIESTTREFPFSQIIHLRRRPLKAFPHTPRPLSVVFKLHCLRAPPKPLSSYSSVLCCYTLFTHPPPQPLLTLWLGLSHPDSQRIAFQVQTNTPPPVIPSHSFSHSPPRQTPPMLRRI